MIRGGFPIKINGYALGSQENLAEGCREVIISFLFDHINCQAITVIIIATTILIIVVIKMN